MKIANNLPTKLPTLKDTTITLPASAWTAAGGLYTQTVPCPAIDESMNPAVALIPAVDEPTKAERFAFACISLVQTEDRQVTFTATEMPQSDIKIALKGAGSCLL